MEFPIKGAIREPLLFLECILFFSLLEISIIFLQKYFARTKEVRNSTELAYGLFFFLYSINWFWRIVSDFYLVDLSFRMFFLQISYLLQVFGILCFIFSIESQKKFIKPYFFTSIISVLLVFSILIILTTNHSIIIFNIIAWLIFSYFLFIYLLYFNSKIKFRKQYNHKIIYFYIEFSMFLFGFFLSTYYVIESIGLGIRFVGAFIQLCSITFIFLYISALPPFTEFDWYDKIKSLHLMERSGLPIFTKHFKEDLKKVNPTLLGGTIVSAQLMLETIVNKKGFSVIKRPDQTLIVYSGNSLTGIIFSEGDLNSLKYLLKRFISRIEEIYNNLLKDWNGDLTVFQPVEAICNEIFNTKQL